MLALALLLVAVGRATTIVTQGNQTIITGALNVTTENVAFGPFTFKEWINIIHTDLNTGVVSDITTLNVQQVIQDGRLDDVEECCTNVTAALANATFGGSSACCAGTGR